MRKIAFIMLLLMSIFLVSCESLQRAEKKFSLTQKVTDNKGNTYACKTSFIELQEADGNMTKVATGKCSFRVTIGDTMFFCDLGIEKRKDFSIETDCTVEVKLEQSATIADEKMILPTTVKGSKRKHFYNRTVAQILLCPNFVA